MGYYGSMRAVIQRVARSSVSVDGAIVSETGRGFMVLLGITEGDGEKDIAYICDKLLNVRVFPDDNYKMNLSLSDIGGDILIVSQFTLYADARNGRRPDYALAAKGDIARPVYESVVTRLKESYVPDRIKTGVFGAMMEVSLVNEGPVTILLDSNKTF